MKKMKRSLAAFAALALSVSAMSVTAFADDEASGEGNETQAGSVKAYVTISNKDLVYIQNEVEITDFDNDGAITISDALYAAHEDGFEGGAEAGYATNYTEQYGLSLEKLWGVENGGSYGYFVNNQSAWSLADTVKDGDYVDAFVYTDTVAFSDAYSFFDVRYKEMDLSESNTIDVVLSCVGYDDDYNAISIPVEGAYITINGDKTEFVTDAEGKVTITIDENGEYVISAVSDTQTLVPPVLEVSADGAEEVVTPSDENKTQEEEETTGEETTGEEEEEEEEEEEQEPEKKQEDAVKDTSKTTTDNPKTGSASLILGAMALAAAGMVASKRK